MFHCGASHIKTVGKNDKLQLSHHFQLGWWCLAGTELLWINQLHLFLATCRVDNKMNFWYLCRSYNSHRLVKPKNMFVNSTKRATAEDQRWRLSCGQQKSPHNVPHNLSGFRNRSFEKLAGFMSVYRGLEIAQAPLPLLASFAFHCSKWQWMECAPPCCWCLTFYTAHCTVMDAAVQRKAQQRLPQTSTHEKKCGTFLLHSFGRII